MLHLLIDTCIWLDLSKDYRSQPLISALKDLIAAGEVELIVPQIVVDEFLRNKSRVIAEAQRSLQSHFRLVREAVNQFGADEVKAPTLQGLNEVDHKIATGSDSVLSVVDAIEKLLLAQTPLPTTDAVKGRVTDRALANLAPYHRAKNSVGDAILVEIYADIVARSDIKDARFAFVTHNIKDFSEPNGDRRLPHPDLARLFAPPKSNYWVSLVDTLKDIGPDLLADHDAEFNYSGLRGHFCNNTRQGPFGSDGKHMIFAHRGRGAKLATQWGYFLRDNPCRNVRLCGNSCFEVCRTC